MVPPGGAPPADGLPFNALPLFSAPDDVARTAAQPTAPSPAASGPGATLSGGDGPAHALGQLEVVVPETRAATKRPQTCSWCSFSAPDGLKSHTWYVYCLPSD